MYLGFSEKDPRVSAVFHVHSNVSYGCDYTFEEIAGKAKDRNIDAVFFSDHDRIKLEYGIRPLENILKMSIDERSVFKYGVKKYYDEIASAGVKVPNVMLFPGMEVSPYYYWNVKGSTFTVEDWHKHLLVYGLSEADMERVPAIHNNKARPFAPLLLWPALFAIPGIFLLKKKKYTAGWVIIAAVALLLVQNYPYRERGITQYAGYLGVRPAQAVIDYVKGKGGLAFWAHPEAENNSDISKSAVIDMGFFDIKAEMRTPPYFSDLKHTSGYTGYNVFWEGYKRIGSAGGIWDGILMEYCEGKRDSPVWASGELDYRQDGESGTFIDSVQNIVISGQNDRASLLNSLDGGRFYVLKKGGFNYYPVLKEFSMGNDVRVKVDFSDEVSRAVAISVIKNGVLAGSFDKKTPAIINMKNELKGKNGYYRVEVRTEGAGGHIISNPLFAMEAR